MELCFPHELIVDVRLVGMGADNEGVAAFQKTHGELIADPVG